MDLFISSKGTPVLVASKNNWVDALALKPKFSCILATSATFIAVDLPKSWDRFNCIPNSPFILLNALE